MTDDAPSGRSIGREMARGTLWMVAMRWVIRLIGLVNTAIIARLLVPEDFGIVALAMIAVDLVVTLTDGDIEMALIRTRSASERLFDTGWTVKILAALATFAVLWFLAAPTAAYFHDDRIETVIHIAALRPLILGFENIGVAEFRRNLRFDIEFRYLVLQRVITFVAGLVLVFLFRNYFALAWSMPASAVLTVALSYAMVPTRPRLSLAHWRDFWQFSRWQMLFNCGRLLGERCDQFVISHIGGVAETGIYAVGFDLAMMPTREIMFPAGRALMPAYSTIAHDPVRMREAFRMVLGFAAVIASSVGIGMSCIADDAVNLVLGGQWSAAVPFVRWLGVYGALEGAWLMLDPFFIAARRERALALSNLVFSAITIPAVAAAAFILGTPAIPGARIAVMTVLLVAIFARMVQWHWISATELGRLLWRPVTASAGMALGLYLLGGHGPALPHLLSMIKDIAAGGLIYVVLLFGLWFLSGRPQGVENDLLGAATSWLKSRRR